MKTRLSRARLLVACVAAVGALSITASSALAAVVPATWTNPAGAGSQSNASTAFTVSVGGAQPFSATCYYITFMGTASNSGSPLQAKFSGTAYPTCTNNGSLSFGAITETAVKDNGQLKLTFKAANIYVYGNGTGNASALNVQATGPFTNMGSGGRAQFVNTPFGTTTDGRPMTLTGYVSVPYSGLQ